MKVGYLDTSVAIAMAFDEAGGAFMARAVRSFDRVYSSPLLETEFIGGAPVVLSERAVRSFLSPVRFVFPDQPLSAFALEAKRAGAVGGCAIHHLATALFLFPEPGEAFFLTADELQSKVAARLGFQCDFL